MGASLYDQFHTNIKGIGSLTQANTDLQNQAQVYESVRDNLTQALNGIKATYTGNAAEAMGNAFQPVTDSINDGANLAGSAAAACDFQSSSFSSAQASITKNVPVPAAPWYEGVDPWSTDHDDAVNQNSQIDSANESAYNTYGSDTTSNVNFVETAAPDTSGFGTFAVQQQGSGTSVGTSSGAPSAGGSGSGGGGYSSSRGSLNHPGGGSSGGYVPPSSGSGGSGPGGQGVTVPPNSPSGSTTTSGFPGTNPGGTSGTGPGGSGPGSGYPGGANPGGGSSPWGAPGGAGGDGPGGVGGVGGIGGYSGGGGTSGFGGGSGASGGGGTSGLGRGGFGSGAGGESGGAGGSGSSAGAGARSGAGSMGAAAEEGELGGAGAAGRSGSSGMGGMGSRGGRGGEDEEHKTAGYLVNEENGNMIVGDFDPVAPPVIGE